MWHLLIISLLTGSIELVERDFGTLPHCQARQAIWMETLDKAKYTVVCVRKGDDHAPQRRNPEEKKQT